jgi:SAM-dependent methyltransferase
MKDNFSDRSQLYARHRPGYPNELIDFIISKTKNRHRVWDCATGNGQVASVLAEHFDRVDATDISESQLSHAIQRENIHYRIAAAENSGLDDHIFDLITVGQAIHWFDFDDFYKEVHRVMKPGGLLTVFGYGNVQFGDAVDNVVAKLYSGILDGYWDPERRYLDEEYQSLPFPFQEIPVPNFTMPVEWERESFLGYLQSWSASQHYRRKNGVDPVDLVRDEFNSVWKDHEIKNTVFPLYVKMGVVG